MGDVQCSIGLSNRQSTVGVPGADIGDQSRACKTRLCLCLYPCSGVDICADEHTEYSTHSVVFVSLLKISELYTISKSLGGPYLKYIVTTHVLQQTICYYYCIDTGVPGHRRSKSGV